MTEAVGGAQGGTGGGRRRGSEGARDEQLQPRAPVPPLCHHLYSFNNYRADSEECEGVFLKQLMSPKLT